MSLERVKKVSLDFYNNAIISVDAKQYDTYTRFINITCTDSGKKVYLDPSTMSAFVRYKKSDGNNVFNNAEILEDGTVQIELTQQMLAASGRSKLDLLIINESGLKVESMADADSFYDLGVSVLSTMSFYVNTHGTAVDHPSISSSNEFDALLSGVSSLIVAETHIKEVESTLQANEEERISNENTRIKAENQRNNDEEARKSAEIKRQDNITGEAYRMANEEARIAAEIKRQDDITGEAYRIANEEARQSTESDRLDAEMERQEKYNTLTNDVETLIENVNSAVESGSIYQSEKGVANGVATLDENGYIPSEQLNIHQTLYGESDPDNELGNDGDYYFKIVKKVSE